MFTSSEGQGFDHTINYSIPPISDDQLRLWLQNDGAYDHLSNSQLENGNPSENSSLEDINLYGFDNSLSSNTQVSSDVQITKSHAGEGKEVAGGESKRHKRTRSTEAHNLNERLRRKKLSQKMAALQEIIPNSVKKDQASTIDDAIKYIKKLQYLVQMMSSEAGQEMILPKGHQGIEPPSLTPFLQTKSGGNGMNLGMSLDFPMGLYNPWLFQSSTANLGLQSIQNAKGQILESMYANGISCFGFPPSILPQMESLENH